MKKILLNILYGIACGCTFFVILGIIFKTAGISNYTMYNSDFIRQAIGSMIVGVAWFVPSDIYSYDKISMALKMIIHIGIGITSLIAIGFYLQWIPVQFGMGTIVTTIILMIVLSAVIYGCFYLYYKNEADKINQKINMIKKRY